MLTGWTQQGQPQALLTGMENHADGSKESAEENNSRYCPAAESTGTCNPGLPLTRLQSWFNVFPFLLATGLWCEPGSLKYSNTGGNPASLVFSPGILARVQPVGSASMWEAAAGTKCPCQWQPDGNLPMEAEGSFSCREETALPRQLPAGPAGFPLAHPRLPRYLQTTPGYFTMGHWVIS